MKHPRATDNDKLHATYLLTTTFREPTCGCIIRGDSIRLRYCRAHVPVPQPVYRGGR